jgi:hypothetical protein
VIARYTLVQSCLLRSRDLVNTGPRVIVILFSKVGSDKYKDERNCLSPPTSVFVPWIVRLSGRMPKGARDSRAAQQLLPCVLIGTHGMSTQCDPPRVAFPHCLHIATTGDREDRRQQRHGGRRRGAQAGCGGPQHPASGSKLASGSIECAPVGRLTKRLGEFVSNRRYISLIHFTCDILPWNTFFLGNILADPCAI